MAQRYVVLRNRKGQEKRFTSAKDAGEWLISAVDGRFDAKLDRRSGRWCLSAILRSGPPVKIPSLVAARTHGEALKFAPALLARKASQPFGFEFAETRPASKTALTTVPDYMLNERAWVEMHGL